MTTFPADNIGPNEAEWQFFRIDRMPDGSIEIESLTYHSTTHWKNRVDQKFLDQYQIKPGERSHNYSYSRVRGDFGGGMYPNVCDALLNLLQAFESESVWKDREYVPLLIQAPVSDVFISSDTVLVSDQPHEKPFVLTAQQLRQFPKTNAAFEIVFKALREDAPRALSAWSDFPIDFLLRQKAEEEIRTLMKSSLQSRHKSVHSPKP